MSLPLTRVMIIAMASSNGGNKTDNTPQKSQVKIGSYKYNKPLPLLYQPELSPTPARAVQHRSEPKLVQIGPTSPNERLRHAQPPYPKHLNNPEKPAFGLILSKCTLTPKCLIEHIYSAFHSDTEEEVSYGIERCTSASIPSSRRVFALAFSTPSLLINHAAIVTSKSGRVGKFTTANAGTSFPE